MTASVMDTGGIPKPSMDSNGIPGKDVGLFLTFHMHEAGSKAGIPGILVDSMDSKSLL